MKKKKESENIIDRAGKKELLQYQSESLKTPGVLKKLN